MSGHGNPQQAGIGGFPTPSIDQHPAATLLPAFPDGGVASAWQGDPATLQALLDASPDIAFLLDSQGTILACNAQLALVGGEMPTRLVGSNLRELLPPDKVDAYWAVGEAMLTTGTPACFEDRMGDRWWEHRVVPVVDAGGSVVRMAVYSRDITEDKLAKAALADERGRLRTILDTIPVGLFLSDAQGQIHEINALAARMWSGKAPPVELPEAYRECRAWWPDSGEPVRAEEWPLTRALREGISTLGAVLDIQRFDGTRGMLMLNAAPLCDMDGQITGGICLMQDISVLKRLEADLVRERAYLDIALDTLPLPVTFFSPKGEAIWRNRAAEEFQRRLGPTGWEGACKLYPDTRAVIPPEEIPEAQARAGKRVSDFEHILLLPDGQEIAMISYSAPIVIEGRVAAVVTAYQDISMLKEYDRAKDEFLAILSHELQTPLTSILGWAQLALQRREPALLEQALDVVQRNARRQKHLIADLLDMSCLLHRKLDLEYEPVDLAQLVRHAVENLEVQAGERDIRLASGACRRPLWVQGDMVRLQQCLDNILQNSLKFTPPEGEITVSCRRRGRQVAVSVCDTGRGMAPKDLATVFAPFRQVERDERAGGLGLGLAVTRGIIELHGGRITASSPGPGRGSTFTIILPLAGDQQQG